MVSRVWDSKPIQAADIVGLPIYIIELDHRIGLLNFQSNYLLYWSAQLPDEYTSAALNI